MSDLDMAAVQAEMQCVIRGDVVARCIDTSSHGYLVQSAASFAVARINELLAEMGDDGDPNALFRREFQPALIAQLESTFARAGVSLDAPDYARDDPAIGVVAQFPTDEPRTTSPPASRNAAPSEEPERQSLHDRDVQREIREWRVNDGAEHLRTLPGGRELDVVGESHYQQEIERAGAGTWNAKYRGQPAVLRREPNNPYDPRAVAVHLPRTGVVGYLKKTIARGYQPVLLRLEAAGIPACVPATIWGRWDEERRESYGPYGVKLDLATPGKCQKALDREGVATPSVSTPAPASQAKITPSANSRNSSTESPGMSPTLWTIMLIAIAVMILASLAAN